MSQTYRQYSSDLPLVRSQAELNRSSPFQICSCFKQETLTDWNAIRPSSFQSSPRTLYAIIAVNRRGALRNLNFEGHGRHWERGDIGDIISQRVIFSRRSPLLTSSFSSSYPVRGDSPLLTSPQSRFCRIDFRFLKISEISHP